MKRRSFFGAIAGLVALPLIVGSKRAWFVTTSNSDWIRKSEPPPGKLMYECKAVEHVFLCERVESIWGDVWVSDGFVVHGVTEWRIAKGQSSIPHKGARYPKNGFMSIAEVRAYERNGTAT